VLKHKPFLRQLTHEMTLDINIAAMYTRDNSNLHKSDITIEIFCQKVW